MKVVGHFKNIEKDSIGLIFLLIHDHNSKLIIGQNPNPMQIFTNLLFNLS